MENVITLLIGLPFVVALLLAFVTSDKVRGKIVYLGGLVLLILSVAAAVIWFGSRQTVTFDLPASEVLNYLVLGGDFFLMFLVIWLSVKHHKTIISVLSIVQTLMVAWVELFGPEVAESHHMRVDWLTIIMLLIIGIIGVLIGVYAVGYMRGYHMHHKEVGDRRRFFFAMIFVFYGAMYGLVTSMNILWLDFFWETTSVCSFLLIGYTQTQEAVNNSFRALWMNLLGGLGIAIAIVYAACMQHTVNLYDIIDNGVLVALGADPGNLLPIAMLAFAALTKSAQMPFSSWLLGAMVAPTPSSALLHSATIVKAGVYMLIRISVAMSGNSVGEMVYLIGGFTFFVGSLLAIAQSDGKKVLAYSTISNLGLITACAGMGKQETVWAALFLILFHAVSKSVLFQCVGAIENATGSRDIEDMQGLATRLPKLALVLLIGIAGMFLAPFGMLISKWAALKAFVDVKSTIMVLFIVFGSATTVFYWTKWMAKILGFNEKRENDVTQRSEYASLFFHAASIILLCLFFPAISYFMIEPLTKELFGTSVTVITEGNMVVMIIMAVAIFIVPLLIYAVTRQRKKYDVIAYMGGINVGDNKSFIDSFGEEMELHVSNWYMEEWLGEKKLMLPSIILGTLIIIVFLGVVLGGAIR